MKTRQTRRGVICLFSVWLLLAALTVPQLAVRVYAEAKNDAVVFSLLYSDLELRTAPSSADGLLEKYKSAGVSAVTVPETTLDALVSRGDLTGLRWHDIRHRFDDEGIMIEELLEGDGRLSYDSHVFIVRREAVERTLDEWLPLYYSPDEYAKAGYASGAAVYVFYDGNTPTYDIRAGFDGEAIEKASAHGFDIALSLRASAHEKTGYIDRMGELIEKYSVRFLNVKADGSSRDGDIIKEAADKNAEGLASLLGEGVTLVLTENADQLSNSRPIGYDELVDAAHGRVMRSYEVYSGGEPDEVAHEYRNSVTDRNIRFLTVTQLSCGGRTADELASLTAEAVGAAAGRLSSLGYRVGGEPESLSGYERPTYVAALAAAFTVVTVSLTAAILSGCCGRRFFAVTAALSLSAFAATFAAPESLLALYPTALAVAVPSAAVTVSFAAAREYCARCRRRDPVTALIIVFSALAVTLVGGAVMASLTSGLEYYINSEIFRGTKLSLLFPIAFSAFAYYIMFLRGGDGEKNGGSPVFYRIMTARVRVWWCLAALAAAAAGIYYIYRSGNVVSVAVPERALRGFLSDTFAARPRTKEFLFAYPCAAVFACRLYRGRAVPFAAALGAAVLPASVMNTFCHVFTDFTVSCLRVPAGLSLGLVTGAAAYAVCAAVAAASGAARAKNRRGGEKGPEELPKA